MLTTFILLVMAQTSSLDFAKVLDIDGDGVIHPMEAADAIQMFYDETGEGMPIADVDQIIEDYQIYCLEEAEFFIEDFDEDSDGMVQYSEIPDQYLAFAKYADINKDSKITLQELLQVDPNSVEVFAQVEIDGIFLDLDENNDDQIGIEAFVKDNIEFAELVLPFDTNKDKRISRDEMVAGFALLDASASFDISGDTALMRGTIDESTPFRVMELVYYHPEVTTIVMTDVPGSVDDDSSLRASRIVRSHGLNTHVPSDGEVASGGTDFFQAGVQRTCGKGALFGVHSWAEFGAEGTDYPRDSEEHEMYLNYYDEMGIPQSFYWYTLEAAPAGDIHYMTSDELVKFGMLTSPIIN